LSKAELEAQRTPGSGLYGRCSGGTKIDNLARMEKLELLVDLPMGGSRPLVIFDSRASEEIAKSVLHGHSYPHVPYVKNVDTIVDIGANVGVAAVWLSILYQPLRVIAIEPAPDPFALLSENAKQWPVITPFQIGLYDQQGEAKLHLSSIDSVTNSIHWSSLNTQATVPIELEDAECFFRKVGVDRIDILKIDTEGCERSILGSIQSRLLGIRVIYVEYHSEDDRRWIDALLGPTHILSRGHVMHEHRGEFCYVSRTAASMAGMDHHEIKPLR
jgi:FkbM family methyltransferase